MSVTVFDKLNCFINAGSKRVLKTKGAKITQVILNFSSEFWVLHIAIVGFQHFVELSNWDVFKRVRNNFKTLSSHVVRNGVVEDIIFLVFWELHLLEMIIKSIVRKLENVLWSTFSVNSVVFFVTNDLSNNSLSFEVLVEWELGNFGHVFVSVNNLIVKIFVVINKEFSKSNFDLLASWLIGEFSMSMLAWFFVFNNIDICVGDDRFLDQIFDFLLDLEL